MNLRTYQAPSMHEALALVKKDLGKDAVILHTRTFRKGGVFGMGGRNVVEVTAATGVNVMGPRRRSPVESEAPAMAGSAAGRAAYGRSRGGTAAPPAAAGDELESSGSFVPPPSAKAPVGAAAPTAPPAAGTDVSALRELRCELNLLRGMVADHVRETRRIHGPALPQELLETYQQLLQNQVEEEIVCQVLDSLQAALKPEQLRDAKIVRRELLRVIEASLPTTGGIRLKQAGKPQIVAFVGPTGVGKTTTIAKLAANFKLRAQSRVGLITIDTYRIAAVDQLRMYAQILDVPLQVVLSPKELTQAVERMADRDIILIDTAGRSQNDQIRIQELKGFLEAARPDEVHLVLSSTASERSLVQTVEKFADVGVDRLVFTKLDEAVGFGVILNVLKRVDKALSYITMGQDVPDDIAPGKRNELAALIIGAQPTVVSRGMSSE